MANGKEKNIGPIVLDLFFTVSLSFLDFWHSDPYRRTTSAMTGISAISSDPTSEAIGRIVRSLKTVSGFALLAVVVLCSKQAFAQTENRIFGSIEMSQMVRLQGNVHPNARQEFDRGPVASNFVVNDISIVLKPTDVQEAELKQLEVEQQDKSSPNYHKWLTPEEYANRFGLNAADINQITNWLQSRGFTIVRVARTRFVVTFSGTASQVASTFLTEIHHYELKGETHFANSSSPSVPKALSGMIAGIRGLHDFRAKPAYTTTLGQTELAPGDIATIYDLTPLYNAGINGAGQTIAIVGQSNINFSDITQFFSGFNLPWNVQAIPVGSNPPGVLTEPAENLNEADLDIEWAGATAPNSKIIYLYATDYSDALTYAIDNKVAAVISVSFAECELKASNGAPQPALEKVLESASPMGISIIAASGDAGAAGCDAWFHPDVTAATNGLAVDYPASSAYVTAVGGTEIEYSGVGAPFWSNSNAANGGSAQSYIPERGWNDSGSGGLESSGGGASILFPKPNWQVGPGVPNDGARDVPDLALASSANHNGYIVCTNGSCAEGISNAIQNTATLPSIFGGTSVATPVFAGIVTLLNQYFAKEMGATTPGWSGLGNINPILYLLGQQTATVFHVVATGNNTNNVVPCAVGTPDCATGSFGFTADGPGYNQVTGLGSVDACSLVMEWTSPSASPFVTGTTMTVSPAVVNAGASVTLTATVVRTNSCPSSGTVTFNIQNQTTAVIYTFTGYNLQKGAATFAAALPAGPYSVYASYIGDANDAASSSILSPLTFAVMPVATTTILTVAPATIVKGGTSVTLTAKVAPTSGTVVPTGTVTINFVNSAGALVLEGTPTLDGGVASYSTSSLPGGAYTITAYYSGDVNLGSSISLNALTLTVTTMGTTSTLTVSAPIVKLGSNVLFTANVAHATGAFAPTGTVEFIEYTFSSASQALSHVALAANGTATFSTTALPAGIYSIQAIYLGDTNYSYSSSTNIPLTISTGGLSSTTTTLTANENLLIVGASNRVTFTAQVTPMSPTVAPTGTVTFYNMLVPGQVLGTAIVPPNGTAILSKAFGATVYSAGYSVVALYGGDVSYAPSVSLAFGIGLN